MLAWMWTGPWLQVSHLSIKLKMHALICDACDTESESPLPWKMLKPQHSLAVPKETSMHYAKIFHIDDFCRRACAVFCFEPGIPLELEHLVSISVRCWDGEMVLTFLPFCGIRTVLLEYCMAYYQGQEVCQFLAILELAWSVLCMVVSNRLDICYEWRSRVLAQSLVINLNDHHHIPCTFRNSSYWCHVSAGSQKLDRKIQWLWDHP